MQLLMEVTEILGSFKLRNAFLNWGLNENQSSSLQIKIKWTWRNTLDKMVSSSKYCSLWQDMRSFTKCVPSFYILLRSLICFCSQISIFFHLNKILLKEHSYFFPALQIPAQTIRTNLSLLLIEIKWHFTNEEQHKACPIWHNVMSIQDVLTTDLHWELALN